MCAVCKAKIVEKEMDSTKEREKEIKRHLEFCNSLGCFLKELVTGINSKEKKNSSAPTNRPTVHL